MGKIRFIKSVMLSQPILNNVKKFYVDINKFASKLKDKFPCIVYLFGSFARGEILDGSDIDLIVVGDFKEKQPVYYRGLEER